MSSKAAAPARAQAATLEGQKQLAQDYLSKHNLLPLLQDISASLICEQPGRGGGGGVWICLSACLLGWMDALGGGKGSLWHIRGMSKG